MTEQQLEEGGKISKEIAILGYVSEKLKENYNPDGFNEFFYDFLYSSDELLKDVDGDVMALVKSELLNTVRGIIITRKDYLENKFRQL